MSAPAVRWPVLLAATRPVLPWGPVLVASGAALAVTSLLAVLPAGSDGLLPVLGVLVLASGCAVAGEDLPGGLTDAAPVAARRRLVARVLLVTPASVAGLGAVMALAALAGARPGTDLVLLWATLTLVATAVSAAAGRSRADVPGPVAAVVLLGGGLVLVTSVPATFLEVPLWGSAPQRVAWAVALSALVLARATRDPAATGR